MSSKLVVVAAGVALVGLLVAAGFDKVVGMLVVVIGLGLLLGNWETINSEFKLLGKQV